MRNKRAIKAWLAEFGDDAQYRMACSLWPSSRRIPLRVHIASTALYWAYLGFWDKVFQTLRRRCCSLNGTVPNWFCGKRFVHYAAVQGRVDVLRVLCNEFRARLCVKDVFGSTPLMCAVYCRQLEAARWLCQCPTLDLYARTLRNETALDLARRSLQDVDAAIATSIATAMRTRARWSGLRGAWFTACARVCAQK